MIKTERELIRELRAALPEADADFLLSAVERRLTPAEAQAEFVEYLRDNLARNLAVTQVLRHGPPKPKFYAASGSLQLIVLATTPQDAALRLVGYAYEWGRHRELGIDISITQDGHGMPSLCEFATDDCKRMLFFCDGDFQS